MSHCPVLQISPKDIALLYTPAPMAASFTQSDALPPKLKKKILDLEFVDLAEPIADTWRWQEDNDTKCCHKPHRTPAVAR